MLYTIPDGQFSPGDKWYVSSEVNGNRTNISFLNAESGIPLYQTFQLGSSRRLGYQFIDDSRILFYDNATIRLVGLGDGHLISGIQFDIPAEQMAWSVDSQALILSSDTEQWQWSLSTGQIIQGTTSASEQIARLVADNVSTKGVDSLDLISPDGRFNAKISNMVACGDGPFSGGCGVWGGKLELYDTATGALLYVLDYPPHDNPGISAVGWSLDGTLMAIGRVYSDSTIETSRIQILDAVTGKELQVLEGHQDETYALLFSPDGKHLASASYDGTVIIWNVSY
jgi:WD40 repeat protein